MNVGYSQGTWENTGNSSFVGKGQFPQSLKGGHDLSKHLLNSVERRR
jgi:hypothetical protein